MQGFEFDGNPGEHNIWLTEDRRTGSLNKLKKWIREGEHKKRVFPLKNFEPILQNLDMPSLISHMENDYYPRATRFWERTQKILSYNVTNHYCRLSVIVAIY